MSGANGRYVRTDDIRQAVAGHEIAVLHALGVRWEDGRRQHVQCPYPAHPDAHPSWRWDERKSRAYCTCLEDGGDDIFDIVMKITSVSFGDAKLKVAEAIGRTDLICTTGHRGQRHQSFDAESLLSPPADKRDDSLPVKYLAHRLGVDVSDVPMPKTPVVGWTGLPYFDPPENEKGKPELAGRWPCVVFGTVKADGKQHAHRIYVAPGGEGKAELGSRKDGQQRNPKKSATGEGTAGCAVLWGHAETAPHVILCEGAETGAAIAFALKARIEAGEVAVAAAITAAGIENFTPWPATTHITTSADRDEAKSPNNAGYRRGERAAWKFAERHGAALTVAIALPGRAGEACDWLDILRRDGPDAVVAGIDRGERYAPKQEPEDDEPVVIHLDTARERVVDLTERTKGDPGAPFEPDALTAMSVIRASDPAAFARLKAELKQAGVPLRDLNREIQRYAFRVIEGGAAGGDGATERAGPYKLINGTICHEKDTQSGRITVPLCNFDARIIGEEIRDDGAERYTVFTITGTLQGGKPLPTAEVPADRYASMGWLVANWGTRAVVNAGMAAKDHLRAAIQLLSSEVSRRTVFAHLGWRHIDGAWFYLTRNGAIGPNGPVPDVHVHAGDSKLNSYALPDPLSGDELKASVRASLSVLELAPHIITYPLLAAVYRAPLGEAAVLDLSVFIAGATGAQKTELTAVAQAHFGSEFHGKNLPGCWSSTGNALERQAFLVKDSVFVVDDFAPSGTSSDVQRLHRDADRLLRGQGNRAGRGRLRPDGTLRPEYYPRGIVVSSGEDIPRGQSLRARIFILELSPGDVDLGRLTQAQEDAGQGLLAQAMAGYVQWLAPQIDKLKSELPERVRALRAAARERAIVHDRTPDIVASLMAGFEGFLNFARDSAAITDNEHVELRERCWSTLMEAAEAQAAYQADEEPAARFLALLASAISSRQAHVANAETNGTPKDAGAWGWHSSKFTAGAVEHEEWRPNGPRIGWLNGDDLYLDPDAAFAAAQRLARDQGGTLTITAQTLWKRMADQGKLISREGARQRNTVRKIIGDKRRTVIHLSASGLICSKTGPTGPTGPRPSGINGLWAGNLGRFSEAPEKPAHETGPQALENANSGPVGPVGPEIEHNPPSSDEIISDGAAADFEGGEI